MRTWTAAIVTVFIVGSAAMVSAAPKKAGKDQFGDLFGAVDKASSKSAKSAKPAHASKAAKSAPKAVAHKSDALVASAAPVPAPNPNQLELVDYAPDRHAWAGP